MRLEINNFKNIWCNKPLIIDTDNKLIKLMGRNWIWKTNTIDSVIFCLYWIDWLKHIWKTFEYAWESNCMVELSNFHPLYKELKIKRVSNYTSWRNKTSTLYINWIKSNDKDINKYLPEIDIAKYILSPTNYINTTKIKKEEFINTLLATTFTETEQNILEDNKIYKKISNIMKVDEKDIIIDEIHSFLSSNFTLKNVNWEFEIYNTHNSSEDNSIEKLLNWEILIDEGILKKIQYNLKLTLKEKDKNLEQLENRLKTVNNNLSLIKLSDKEINKIDLLKLKEENNKLIEQYNLWNNIKEKANKLDEKSKTILEGWIDKYLKWIVWEWEYSSQDWELFFLSNRLDTNFINKLSNKISEINDINLHDYNISYSFDNDFNNLISNIKNSKFKNYIEKEKAFILSWKNISNIIKLIEQKEIKIKGNIKDNLGGKGSIILLLKDAVEIKNNKGLIYSLNDEEKEKIWNIIWSIENNTKEKEFLNELMQSKLFLKEISDKKKQLISWKFTEIFSKYEKFNKIKNEAKRIELFKEDYNKYNKDKSKFLLKNNIISLKKNREDIEAKLSSIVNLEKNKELYNNLSKEKKTLEDTIKSDIKYKNLLEWSFILYNDFNKISKENNLNKLNSYIKSEDYKFNDKYELQYQKKDWIFMYNNLSSGEKIMFENKLSEIFTQLSDKKFPFQLIDNLWELDDINLSKVEKRLSGTNLVRFMSKISNEDKLKVNYISDNVKKISKWL